MKCKDKFLTYYHHLFDNTFLIKSSDTYNNVQLIAKFQNEMKNVFPDTMRYDMILLGIVPGCGINGYLPNHIWTYINEELTKMKEERKAKAAQEEQENKDSNASFSIDDAIR